MSTLWTPDGERPVERPGSGAEPGPQTEAAGEDREPTEEEMRAHVEQLRQQLAETPVEAVIAQLCSQLFEVAALHLSMQPPILQQAQLAIDAMGTLVEGLGDRLGPDAAPLHDGLTQLRLAFVQIRAAFVEAQDGSGPDSETESSSPGGK